MIVPTDQHRTPSARADEGTRSVVRVALVAALFVLAPQALADGSVSGCTESTFRTYQDAKAQDDTAYEKAIAGCQQVYGKPGMTGQLLDCTSKAAANHKKNRKEIVDAYNEARTSCMVRIMYCKNAAQKAYVSRSVQLIAQKLKEVDACATQVGTAGFDDCLSHAEAKYKAASADNGTTKAYADKQCEQIAAMPADGRPFEVAAGT